MLNKIKNDLSAAMKLGDKHKVQALRNMIAAIKDREINNNKELSNDELINVLTKQAKQIKESISQYKAGGRLDLVENEERELNIVNIYLPKPTCEKLIAETINKIVNDIVEPSMADFGKIMGRVMVMLPPNTDGKIVQEFVKKKLIS